MAEEDHRTVSTRATQSGGSEGGGAGDPRDDWLAGDAGDLDWFPGDDAQAPGGSGSRAQGAGGGGRNDGPRAGSSGGSPALEDLNEFLHRRGALLVLLAAVAVIILVAILAFGGGGGGSTPPATTPTTTPPAKTTPATNPATTTTKTTTTTHTASTVTLPPVGYLRSGDTGAEVKALQQALITLGYTGLKADGNFGPATAAALTAFQTANGLTADGVAGQKTVDAINAALATKG